MLYIFLINTMLQKKKANIEEQYFEAAGAMGKPRVGFQGIICGRHHFDGPLITNLWSSEQLIFCKTERQPHHFG